MRKVLDQTNYSVRRKNWIPTKDSSVCQVHFAPDAWERMRVDGKLKLKYKAVPTLFNNLIRKSSYASTSESVEEALHPSTLKEIDVLSNQENDANNEADEEINNFESTDESEEDELSLKNVKKLIKSDQETYDKQSFEKLFKALEKSERLRKIQKKKLKVGKNTSKLKKQIHCSLSQLPPEAKDCRLERFSSSSCRKEKLAKSRRCFIN
ncbi:hypothetical protein PV327_010094 [Microctonus hyperodae]|uniref:THAP-type domain-containing protein n=1 Tax=Microctonus hyperodae TaxID=165561 RepID=A0AA39F2C9_MICHY|nr:hypothetical protein PV327_010094 [Microctonus hyperodae]